MLAFSIWLPFLYASFLEPVSSQAGGVSLTALNRALNKGYVPHPADWTFGSLNTVVADFPNSGWRVLLRNALDTVAKMVAPALANPTASNPVGNSNANQQVESQNPILTELGKSVILTTNTETANQLSDIANGTTAINSTDIDSVLTKSTYNGTETQGESAVKTATTTTTTTPDPSIERLKTLRRKQHEELRIALEGIGITPVHEDLSVLDLIRRRTTTTTSTTTTTTTTPSTTTTPTLTTYLTPQEQENAPNNWNQNPKFLKYPSDKERLERLRVKQLILRERLRLLRIQARSRNKSSV